MVRMSRSWRSSISTFPKKSSVIAFFQEMILIGSYVAFNNNAGSIVLPFVVMVHSHTLVQSADG